MVKAYLSIGSNINHDKNIRKCLKILEKEFKLVKVSNFYETAPYGYEQQDNFINLAAEIETSEGPEELLKKLKSIEKKLGRKRMIKNGPRTIDLDLLLHGDKVINKKDIRIPHHGLFERDFMLVPLLDIEPEIINPLTKKKIKYLKKSIKYNQIIGKIKL